MEHARKQCPACGYWFGRTTHTDLQWDRKAYCDDRCQNTANLRRVKQRRKAGIPVRRRDECDIPPEEILERAMEVKAAHYAAMGCTYGGPD